MEPLAGLEADAESIEPELNAVCARHPDRRASIVCPYCGSFACSECTLDTLWGDAMCEACNEHGRAQYPLPWETSVSPIAFVHSAYLVFADTQSFFSAFPHGRVRRALLYALQTAALSIALVTLTHWLFVPSYWAADTPGLAVVLIRAARHLPSVLAALLLLAAMFHAIALLLGGRAPFAVALRAAFYLSTLLLLDTLGDMGERVLAVGTMRLLLDLFAMFFLAWALSLLGEHRYALPRAKAIGAAIAVVLALVALATGVLFALALVRLQ
jgi:hypothetical protein